MIEKYIKKALECSRLHAELVDRIMIGEITENKVSELTDREKQQEIINRQKEQIEALIAGQETLQKALNEKIAEVEALNGNLYTVSSACKQRRDEAVKEFAERLKKRKYLIGAYEYPNTELCVISADEIDNLVKEMVGEE